MTLYLELAHNCDVNERQLQENKKLLSYVCHEEYLELDFLGILAV